MESLLAVHTQRVLIFQIRLFLDIYWLLYYDGQDKMYILRAKTMYIITPRVC